MATSSFRRKKVARRLPYRKRHLRLNSNQQVQCKRLQRIILALLLKVKRSSEGTEQAHMVLRLATLKYLSLAYHTDTDDTVEPPPQFDRSSINKFTDSECRLDFRFDKPELGELFRLLNFPRVVRFDNRSILSGEEVFLRGMYEFSGGENKQKISSKVFGRDFSAQSRAFSWFIDHLYDNFRHLVHDNLDWWYRNGLMEASAEAIQNKMGVAFPGAPRVAMFIDCNCLPTSVVGGGPAEEGANAARWDDRIQRAFYNGWKSVHGLKHQTVDNAFGMTVDMFGPTSLRRNDLELLRLSDINERVAAMQTGGEADHIIFGDSAYKPRSHIRSYYFAGEQGSPADYWRWNNAMKRVRISIEWNYGYTAGLFKYLVNPEKLKVMQSARVAKIYTVATLLRNFHIACYGGQTSNYFGLTTNFLAHYIHQTDL